MKPQIIVKTTEHPDRPGVFRVAVEIGWRHVTQIDKYAVSGQAKYLVETIKHEAWNAAFGDLREQLNKIESLAQTATLNPAGFGFAQSRLAEEIYAFRQMLSYPQEAPASPAPP